MICSSLNRLRFIRPSPLQWSDSTQIWRSFGGSGQSRNGNDSLTQTLAVVGLWLRFSVSISRGTEGSNPAPSTAESTGEPHSLDQGAEYFRAQEWRDGRRYWETPCR
jgi:hypothetical protein